MSEPPIDPPGPPPWPPHDQPRSGLSNTAKFWVGMPMAILVVPLVGFFVGIGATIGVEIGGDQLGGIAAGLVLLLSLGGFVAALVFEKTRWFAIGIMAGTAVLLVLLAGACAAILIAYSNV